jgi:hypothetical protein
VNAALKVGLPVRSVVDESVDDAPGGDLLATAAAFEPSAPGVLFVDRARTSTEKPRRRVTQ